MSKLYKVHIELVAENDIITSYFESNSQKQLMKTEKKKNAKGFGAISIYETLRDEILSLVLEPSQIVDELSLAKRFGVSRSPVRDALVRLVSESLLKTLPNKGTIVAPLRIEEFPQYVDALDLIQRAITRLAAENRTEADLVLLYKSQEDFAKYVSDGNVLGMILSNRDFHIAISKAGKNRYLEQSYRQILDDGRRSLRLYFRSFNDVLPKKLTAAHNHIIDAISAQDGDLAEQLAHQHTLEMQQRFIDYLGSRRLDNFAVTVKAAS